MPRFPGPPGKPALPAVRRYPKFVAKSNVRPKGDTSTKQGEAGSSSSTVKTDLSSGAVKTSLSSDVVKAGSGSGSVKLVSSPSSAKASSSYFPARAGPSSNVTKTSLSSGTVRVISSPSPAKAGPSSGVSKAVSSYSAAKASPNSSAGKTISSSGAPRSFASSGAIKAGPSSDVAKPIFSSDVAKPIFSSGAAKAGPSSGATKAIPSSSTAKAGSSSDVAKATSSSGTTASPGTSIEKSTTPKESEEKPSSSDQQSERPSLFKTGSDSMAITSGPLHYLANKWTLWYYIQEKGKSWEECQQPVCTFETVEHFWSIYNNMLSPSSMPPGSDLSLFKKNGRPMWEDAINRNGGRWIINVQRGRLHNKLDDVWLEVLLFLIGENFPYSDDVCGTVLSHRAYGDKVAIWTSNQDENRIKSIGHSAKKTLELDISPLLTFESHIQTQFNARVYGKASSETLYKI